MKKSKQILTKRLPGMKKGWKVRGYEFLNAIENMIAEIVAHPETSGSKAIRFIGRLW